MSRRALRVWAEVAPDGEHCSTDCVAYRHCEPDGRWRPTLRYCTRFGALTAHDGSAWRPKECLAAESKALRDTRVNGR